MNDSKRNGSVGWNCLPVLGLDETIILIGKYCLQNIKMRSLASVIFAENSELKPTGSHAIIIQSPRIVVAPINTDISR